MGDNAAVVRICEKCQKEYRPWSRKRPSRFCSYECGGVGRKPSTPSRPCPTCKVIFRPSKSDRTYCSRACYVAATGGRYIDSEGYVRMWAPTEVGAYPSGQMLEHRLVMQRALGRALEAHETVHHINGDRADNRLENLQLRSGRHGSGVVHRCIDCGSGNIETVPIT